ncbi:VOC family protein [Heyndrickxia sporothermodurans]
MSFQFDHLVHFVEEPKKVIKVLEENGIHAVEGGVHQNRGTYNALSYFDLSYIEFLSTYDRKLVEQTEHLKYSLIETVVQNGFKEGFTRFAIRTNDINASAEHFRQKGLEVYGPVPLSRKRPDGSLLHWRLLYVGKSGEELSLPFIIQWDENDDERRKDLIERGVIKSHSAQIQFSHISIAVRELEKTVEKWTDWLDLKAGDEFIDEGLQAKCKTLELEGGRIVFSSPIGKGIVSKVLEKNGEGPFQVHFTGGNHHTHFELFGGRYQLA